MRRMQRDQLPYGEHVVMADEAWPAWLRRDSQENTSFTHSVRGDLDSNIGSDGGVETVCIGLQCVNQI
eukprot:12933704-Prorocentrum_lima.AAC.1